MRTARKRCLLLVSLLGVWFTLSGICYAEITTGQSAPLFALKDHKGQTQELSRMKDQPMLVIYFFDAESRPSQEGLLSLNQLVKKYKGKDMTVWAVTTSPKDKVSAFIASSGLEFPVLHDGGEVSMLYNAKTVLPTVCILGPGLRVLDLYQGGGKASEAMLVRIAERNLQRKLTSMAKLLTDEVIKKDPQNVKARMVNGWAAVREGKLKEAEETFADMVKRGGEGDVLGKEGLAAVYERKGETDKALEAVAYVEKKAPDRAYGDVIKGNILYSQGKTKEAEASYKTAIRKKTVETYQDPVRYNQLGRLNAKSGQYKEAREQYERAVDVDPYFIEATTNKGFTYEKEGRWEKALDSYRQALAMEKNDLFAAVLAKKSQEMLDLQKDAERSKRIDQLVKDLAERYRRQKETRPTDEDTWTSQPMVLTFVDFQEKGALSERDGFSTVLTAELGDHLNASGRVKVVERVMVDRLLQELNLGTSELADKETALRLGRILAARLIGTGSLLFTPQSTLLSLRLIDTETTTIPQVTTKQIGPQAQIETELFQLNRDILKTVISQYPLRGYVAKLTGDQAVVNLGSKQGVVLGTKFEVLGEAESIEYKGKVLKAAPKAIGIVEVVKVEPEFSYAKVLNAERPLKTDDKVQERIEETVQK